MNAEKHAPVFYGTATVGAKGQIVIPVEARERMKIKPGDKVVIIGPHNKPQVIGLCSESALSSLLERIDNKLSSVREALQNQKEDKK